MQVLDRLAAELPLGRSVDESVRGDDTFARLVEVGDALKEQGAGAVILGCAGLAARRAGLEARLGIPVIDPTQAAVGLALTTLLAGRGLSSAE
jgi:Asp/Glu/hydantoin racemase